MKAKEFLESNVHEDTDPYTASLTAYALTLLDSAYAKDARDRLYDSAITSSDTTHWSLREENEGGLGEILPEMKFAFGDSWKQTGKKAIIEILARVQLSVDIILV